MLHNFSPESEKRPLRGVRITPDRGLSLVAVSRHATDDILEIGNERVHEMAEEAKLTRIRKRLRRLSGNEQVGGFNQSRKRHPEIECDLSGIDLMDKDLSGVDFRGVILKNANLRGVELEKAQLQGAILEGVNLREADLTGADLSEADLRGAILDGADLTDARLNGTKLRGVDLGAVRGLTEEQLAEADINNEAIDQSAMAA